MDRAQTEDSVQLAMTRFYTSGDQKYLEDVFALTEKNKAAFFTALLDSSQVYSLAGVPDSLLRREHRLISSLKTINSRLSDIIAGDTSSHLQQLARQQQRYETELLSLKRIFEQYYPRYYRLKYDQKIYIAFDIQKLLKPHEAMLIYITGATKIFAIYLDRHKLLIKSTGERLKTAMLIDSLYNMISRFDPAQTRVEAAINFNNVSYPLYQSLIEPVEKLIGTKRLIIVPDGNLCKLPFGILVEDPAEVDFREMHYLLNKHAVSYDYAASLWATSQKITPQFVRGNLVSFLKTNDSNDQAQTIHTGAPDSDDDLCRREIHELLGIMQGRFFDGRHASLKRFLQRSPEYKMIHLCLPASIRNDHPLRSSIEFYDNNEHHTLFLHEFFNLELFARLMVLSHARVVNLSGVQNSGLLVLNKGMLSAGIPAFLFSLWNINQGAAIVMMKNFYAALRKGDLKDDALQIARQQYLKSVSDVMAHPAFWSGFVIAGNNSTIDRPARPWYLYIFIALPLMITLLLLLLRHRQYRHRRTAV